MIRKLLFKKVVLEWVLSKIIVGVSEFWFEGRSIRFRPSMVGKVLGISSGNEPIKFDAEVCSMFNGKDKLAITRAIAICFAKHNQDAFMCSFMLVALGIVLCLGTKIEVFAILDEI